MNKPVSTIDHLHTVKVLLGRVADLRQRRSFLSCRELGHENGLNNGAMGRNAGHAQHIFDHKCI